MHVLAMLLAHPAVAHKGPGIVSEITHYLKEGGGFLVRHLGIVLGLFIIYFLWHRAGAVLWQMIVVLVVGILDFPSVAPASIQASLGKVTKSGQHVGSTGLSMGLLVILVLLTAATVIMVMRSKHPEFARQARKMARQPQQQPEGGGEG